MSSPARFLNSSYKILVAELFNDGSPVFHNGMMPGYFRRRTQPVEGSCIELEVRIVVRVHSFSFAPTGPEGGGFRAMPSDYARASPHCLTPSNNMRRNSGFGAAHSVRYLSNKDSQLFSLTLYAPDTVRIRSGTLRTNKPKRAFRPMRLTKRWRDKGASNQLE